MPEKHLAAKRTGMTDSTAETMAEPDPLLLASRQDSHSLFSKLPPERTWIRHGLVERQTMSADVQWHPRLMILTAHDIIFARQNTDVIVDRLHLKDITFVSKVDRADESMQSSGKKKKSRRSSVMFAATFKMDAMEEIYDGARDSFAFEIRTSVDDRLRSYFARVDSVEDCEAWVTDIKSAMKESITQLASGDSWWTWTQQRARFMISLQIHNTFALRQHRAALPLSTIKHSFAHAWLTQSLLSFQEGARQHGAAVRRVRRHFLRLPAKRPQDRTPSRRGQVARPRPRRRWRRQAARRTAARPARAPPAPSPPALLPRARRRAAPRG